MCHEQQFDSKFQNETLLEERVVGEKTTVEATVPAWPGLLVH